MTPLLSSCLSSSYPAVRALPPPDTPDTNHLPPFIPFAKVNWSAPVETKHHTWSSTKVRFSLVSIQIVQQWVSAPSLTFCWLTKEDWQLSEQQKRVHGALPEKSDFVILLFLQGAGRISFCFSLSHSDEHLRERWLKFVTLEAGIRRNVEENKYEGNC